MINILCFNCRLIKVNAILTGSFLCDECREKEFARLRKLVRGVSELSAKNRKKTKLEIVQELSDEGLKPREISERTGIPIGTVYSYRSQAKPVNVSETGPDQTEAKEKEVDHDAAKYQTLMKNFNSLMEKYNQLEQKYHEEIECLENELAKEKEKHRILFKYLQISLND